MDDIGIQAALHRASKALEDGDDNNALTGAAMRFVARERAKRAGGYANAPAAGFEFDMGVMYGLKIGWIAAVDAAQGVIAERLDDVVAARELSKEDWNDIANGRDDDA
jgi:hypothetical protein